MKKTVMTTALLAASLTATAGTMGEDKPVISSPYFISIDAGYAWSRDAGVSNADPAFWDPAFNGYDENLGEMGFYSLAVGKTVHEYVDVSLSFNQHLEGNYQKYQVGPATANIPGFTGTSRTRFFKLDNTAALINASLHPAAPLYQVQSLRINPFIGGGIGVARNVVHDFHTVSLTTVSGSALGSSTSIGDDNTKNSFAWQGNAGINIRPANSNYSVDIGYRYFDGGKFETANVVVSNSGTPTGLNAAQRGLSGRLKTNEAFIGFNWYA